MKLTLAAISGLFVAANAASLTPNAVQQVLGASPKQPNFIFVITDDQDLKLDSVDYMPLTQKHLKQKGTFFRNHFVTTALCCPSRVSLWTGRQAHNTNVTDISPPYGKF
jgi:arylsulfatase A-like enzyme